MCIRDSFLNYDEFIAAVRLLVNEASLSESRMTVSTSGIVPGILRLAGEPVRPRLAISLNAPNDAIREAIMPCLLYTSIFAAHHRTVRAARPGDTTTNSMDSPQSRRRATVFELPRAALALGDGGERRHQADGQDKKTGDPHGLARLLVGREDKLQAGDFPLSKNSPGCRVPHPSRVLRRVGSTCRDLRICPGSCPMYLPCLLYTSRCV